MQLSLAGAMRGWPVWSGYWLGARWVWVRKGCSVMPGVKLQSAHGLLMCGDKQNSFGEGFGLHYINAANR